MLLIILRENNKYTISWHSIHRNIIDPFIFAQASTECCSCSRTLNKWITIIPTPKRKTSEYISFQHKIYQPFNRELSFISTTIFLRFITSIIITNFFFLFCCSFFISYILFTRSCVCNIYWWFVFFCTVADGVLTAAPGAVIWV